MKIRKLNKKIKRKMRYAPRWLGTTATGREEGVYFEDWCCRSCYWDFGHSFLRSCLHKHDCTESNYLGLLKKYWKTSKPDYFAEYNEAKNQSNADEVDEPIDSSQE